MNSRRVSAYSKRRGLPASSRTPSSSIKTWSTLVAPAMSATNETGVALRNFVRSVARAVATAGPVSTPLSEMRVARRPRSCRKSPSSAGTAWASTASLWTPSIC